VSAGPAEPWEGYGAPTRPADATRGGLRIGSADLARIRAHGEAAYPEECCGVLIGRESADKSTASVDRIVAASNERADSRHNRYVISPQALLEAQREARASGLDIVGYYHSHPDHPARPSEFDREHAWPGTSYVIVSIEKGKAVDCRSWRLSDDRAAFEEETLAHPRSGRGGLDGDRHP
jgi:proteasome lid subunit RPN8/RPN11